MASYFLMDGSSLSNYYVTTNPQRGPNTGYLQSNGKDISSNFKLYVYGTLKASNYFIENDDIGKYYQYDTSYIYSGTTYSGTTYNLGASNMAPWNVSTIQMGNAKWIWNVANANLSASVNIYIWFYYTFYYSGSTTTATLYASCDNACTFYLNGTAYDEIMVGWPLALTRDLTNIVNGLNYIRVCAYNSGSTAGPAGLLMAIYIDSINVANTSSAWVNTISTTSTYNAGAAPFSTTLV